MINSNTASISHPQAQVPLARNARILLVFLLFSQRLLLGQNHIDVSFEDYPVGSIPAFVTRDGPTLYILVSDGSTDPFVMPPDDGKFLGASGGIRIKSPDGNPILSYSLRLFMPSVASLQFGIDDGQAHVKPAASAWTTYEATFLAPRADIGIYSYYSVAGESFPENFGLDSIHFVTIPEPETWAFLAMGLTAFFLACHRTHKPTRLA